MELIAFIAWQVGGPRVLQSFGAEGYKRNGRVVLEALPVRLAYYPPEPGPPPPVLLAPAADLEEVRAWARWRGSPPQAWLELLAPSPQVLSAWWNLYRQAVEEEGRVGRRLKQLLRVLVAEESLCPAWAPPDSPSLREAGVGRGEREALARGDWERFGPAEQAALRYAQGLIWGEVDEEAWACLEEHFEPASIVELGMATAVQLGAARVTRVLA